MSGSGKRNLISAAQLRLELTARNLARAGAFVHETTFGRAPNVIYACGEDGRHGNFVDASYRRICSDREWSKRLNKVYTAGKRVPRSGDRRRGELECANSSDALLMNIFCYPGIASNRKLCSFLGVDCGLQPEFGFRPFLPMHRHQVDRTEMDMRLGLLLVEAKLTESGFQRASVERVLRYREVEEVFAIGELPLRDGFVESYQLIRGVLAAQLWDRSFVVICDERRGDLFERWFAVIRAVRSAELRSRLVLLTWQELACFLPPRLRSFLKEKYGIAAAQGASAAGRGPYL